MKDLSKFATVCNKAFGRPALLIKKHSPEILTGVGIVGVVTSAVLAAKATLSLEEKIDGMQQKLANIEDHLVIEPEKYTKDDAVKARTHVYVTTALEIGKLYGPSVTLGMASIGCILGAHGIMKKRNAALAAAYKAVEETFNKYKQRVIEELGEEQERDIAMDIRDVEVEEDGKKTIKKTGPSLPSPYAKFFDEYSTAWEKDADYNLMYVRAQQQIANDILQSRGHIFLNEVYDMLGLPHTQAGSVTGWIAGQGDNFVDFGMYDFESEEARAFVNGLERSILLDFNVQGTIFDKI